MHCLLNPRDAAIKRAILAYGHAPPRHTGVSSAPAAIPMSRPTAREAKPHLMRQRIAAHAARLMAEDGIDDFSLAKRKAARQLSAAAAQSLPSNEEIEAELKAYRELFLAEEHPSQLRELRLIALAAMRYFEKFEPYLAGPVLKGSAGPHSAINVQLFAANEKELELFLLDRRIFFTIEDEPRARPGREHQVSVFCLDWQDAPLRLALFESVASRSTPKADPVTGLPERAGIAFVERMLDPGESASKK
jgi:hypothetical protein